MSNRLLAHIVACSLFVAGCSGGSEEGPPGETVNPNVSVQIERGGITLAAVRDRIRFPDVRADGPTGAMSAPLSFVVRNTGTETMTVYRVEPSSGDGADFAIGTSGIATSVAPSASTEFTISFDPLSTGDKEATIVVVTNAGTDNHYEIIVRGVARPVPVNAAHTSTHDFTPKTIGDLTVRSRSVIPGNVRPTGGLRIIVGCGQNAGANQGSRMTVFKKSTSTDPWAYEWESEQVFTTGSMDMFEPLLAHDFDGDGVDEILGKLNQHAAFIAWNGVDAYERIWTAESNVISLEYGLALADVDRDGRDELLAGDRTSTKIFSWDDGFTNFTLDATLEGGSGFNVGVGDLDGDGFLEVATASEGTGANDIHVYRWDGETYAELYSGVGDSTVGYTGLTAVDLDGDGVDALLGASPNSAASQYLVSLFEWNGSSLDETSIVQNTSGKYRIVAGDFDRDGLAEALVDQNGPSTLIVEDTGSAIEALDSGTAYYVFMTPFDHDADGFPEVFVTDNAAATGSVFIIRDDVSNP